MPQAREEAYFQPIFSFTASPLREVWQDFIASLRYKNVKISAQDIEGFENLLEDSIGTYDSLKEPTDYSLYDPEKVAKWQVMTNEIEPFVASPSWGSLEVTTEDIEQSEVYFIRNTDGIWVKYVKKKVSKALYVDNITFDGENMVVSDPSATINWQFDHLEHFDNGWNTFAGSTIGSDIEGSYAELPNAGSPSVVYKDGIFTAGTRVRLKIVVDSISSGTLRVLVDDQDNPSFWFSQQLFVGENIVEFNHVSRTDTTVILQQLTTGMSKVRSISVYNGISQDKYKIPLKLTQGNRFIKHDYQDTTLYDQSGITITNGTLGIIAEVAGTSPIFTNLIKNKKVVLNEFSDLVYLYQEISPTEVYFGFKSANVHSYTHNVMCSYLTSGANAGKIQLITGAANNVSYSTAQNSDYVIGDVLKVTIARRKVNYTFIISNLTKGWTIKHTVENTPLGIPFVAHNSAHPTMSLINGKITLFSEEYLFALSDWKIICLGDSITFGQAATTAAQRYPDLLNVSAMASGGGADGTVETVLRIDEIIALMPKMVTLMIGGNDILFGVPAATWKANYKLIRDRLFSAGIEVIHLLPTPRSGADQLINYITTEAGFMLDMVIDTNTLLASGNSQTLNAMYDSGDGLHLNDVGFQKLADIINLALGL